MTMHPQKTDKAVIASEKKLASELTGVSEQDIEVNDVGWTSRVYIVGKGKFVIKFPRNDDTRKEYVHEKAVLEMLRGLRSEVQIPQLRWFSPNNDYLGYEGIVGKAFDQAVLPKDKLRTIGESIGHFLRQLHSQVLPKSRTITIEDEVKELHDMYKRISNIEKYFGVSELKDLENLVFEEIPTELSRLGADYVLCHGDLGYWNLILKSNSEVGVIDFGDIGMWDKSKDFIGLEDEEILNEAVSVYGGDDLLKEKISVRQKLLWILDLRYYIDVKDAVRINKTVAKLKSVL